MLDSTQYSDVIKKINYHKETILQEFIQKGIYPDNTLISNRLKNIDSYIALFKNSNVVTGEKFNVEEYNEYIKLIYKDLKILFELLEELQIKEYYRQQNFIESYINELYSIVNTYESRAKYENTSTTLGKTLLFKNNGFTIENDNSTTIINLDNIEINNASTLYCIANINNIDPENLIFVFTDENDNSHQVTPYNYSNETLTMPGEKTIKETYVEIQNEQKLNSPFILSTDAPIDYKNKYTILGGKNKMFINYDSLNSSEVEEAPTSLGTFITKDKCRINFYIVNGNSVSFKFNKKPLYTNFPIEEHRISNLDKIHYFFIECEKDFSFEIELDKGDVYAIKEPGIINNDKLYYTGSNLIDDFNIIEEQSGEPKNYKAQLKIYNDNDSSYDIESIVIKQLE